MGGSEETPLLESLPGKHIQGILRGKTGIPLGEQDKWTSIVGALVLQPEMASDDESIQKKVYQTASRRYADLVRSGNSATVLLAGEQTLPIGVIQDVLVQVIVYDSARNEKGQHPSGNRGEIQIRFEATDSLFSHAAEPEAFEEYEKQSKEAREEFYDRVTQTALRRNPEMWESAALNKAGD